MMRFNEIWAGLDVAKASFDATLLMRTLNGVRELGKGSFGRNAKGVAEFLDWSKQCGGEPLDGCFRLHAVMEATGSYSSELSKMLGICADKEDAEVSTSIVTPLQIKHYAKGLGLKNSTDPIDSGAIALFGLEREPRPQEKANPVLEKLRAMVRARADIVEQRTAIGNRLKEAAPASEAAKTYGTLAKAFDKEIARLERLMAKAASEDAELKMKVKLLDSIPGIASLTAITLLAELGDLTRFSKRGATVAYAGMNPSVKISGSSVRRKGGISKHGSPEARRVLYLAVKAAVQRCKESNPFSAFHQKKIAEGKSYNCAIVAGMRKMLLVARAILKSNQPFSKKEALT